MESSRTSSRTDFEVLGLVIGRKLVLENWPVLGSRTALFFGMLKICGALEKFFGKRFLVEIAWKIFVKTFFFFFFFFFGDRLKNFCEDLFFFFFFFFWRALALCVLGPWPWPRAFLSLASRVSVLGKAVLGFGLGLGFFLCPWPWPRALCPRLHLCYSRLEIGKHQQKSKENGRQNQWGI